MSGMSKRRRTLTVPLLAIAAFACIGLSLGAPNGCSGQNAPIAPTPVVTDRAECQRKSCADCVGQTGLVDDGCGGRFNCDAACDPENPCTPTTCDAQKATCGFLSDGCAGTLDCGQDDANNCGACGNVCLVGTACESGVCTSPCGGGARISLSIDNANCGACDNACASGTICANGVCAGAATVNAAKLPSGALQLSGSGTPNVYYIVEVTHDLSRKGWVELGTVKSDASGAFTFVDITAPNFDLGFYRAEVCALCNANNIVCGGDYVNPSSDASNCGSCGTVCDSGLCSAGICWNATSALSGYWEFDDGSGVTSADASGNGNAASFSGAVSWTTGVIGNAVQLGGAATDFISAPLDSIHTTYFGNNNPMTLAVWAYFTAGTNGPIFGLGSLPGGGDFAWAVLSVNGATLYGAIPSQTDPNPISVTLSDDDLNTWHHVALTYDPASGGTETLYVDGQPAGSKSIAYSAPAQPVYFTTSLSGSQGVSKNGIGVSQHGLTTPGGVNSSLAGTIDELRVYKSVLSPTQIQTLSVPAVSCTANEVQKEQVALAAGFTSAVGDMFATWHITTGGGTHGDAGSCASCICRANCTIDYLISSPTALARKTKGTGDVTCSYKYIKKVNAPWGTPCWNINLEHRWRIDAAYPITGQPLWCSDHWVVVARSKSGKALLYDSWSGEPIEDPSVWFYPKYNYVFNACAPQAPAAAPATAAPKTSDSNNCTTGSTSCESDVCTLTPTGDTSCSQCTNLLDNNNCGGCGIQCSGSDQCKDDGTGSYSCEHPPCVPCTDYHGHSSCQDPSTVVGGQCCAYQIGNGNGQSPTCCPQGAPQCD